MRWECILLFCLLEHPHYPLLPCEASMTMWQSVCPVDLSSPFDQLDVSHPMPSSQSSQKLLCFPVLFGVTSPLQQTSLSPAALSGSPGPWLSTLLSVYCFLCQSHPPLQSGWMSFFRGSSPAPCTSFPLCLRHIVYLMPSLLGLPGH